MTQDISAGTTQIFWNDRELTRRDVVWLNRRGFKPCKNQSYFCNEQGDVWIVDSEGKLCHKVPLVNVHQLRARGM